MKKLTVQTLVDIVKELFISDGHLKHFPESYRKRYRDTYNPQWFWRHHYKKLL